MSRYDLVLAVIPTVFITAILTVIFLRLSTRTGVSIAAIIGVLALIDALYLNPPTRPENRF